MKIKICGIRDQASVDACNEAQVDFVGLNFVSWSKRKVDIKAAHPLISRLKGPLPVGLFMDQEPQFILSVIQELGLSIVQLHGKEPPDFVDELKKKNIQVIKTFSVGGECPPEKLIEYQTSAAYGLFDGLQPGSGQTYDLTRIPKTKDCPLPYFVAGGLTEHNVAEVIQQLNPFGVDTASGAETQGVPSPSRILRFVKAARGAL